MARRLPYRYAAILFPVLFFILWLRGWFDSPLHTPEPLFTNEPTQTWLLPVVYMEKDIKNKTILYKSRPVIPKIIHQTWKSSSIPEKFLPLVITWLRVNPQYEYWFWSDADAHRFVKTYYPQYYDMFRGYKQNIMRADAIRYFILYHFGGWYADMDMQAIKPLDDFTNLHQCVISQEPWAHTKMFWKKHRLACNAMMASRPGHPFFDLVIKELPLADKRAKDLMSKTGPKLIDNTVTLYEQRYGKHYTENMTLFLAESNTFLPTLASNALALVKKRCKSKQSDPENQKICDDFKAKNFRNEVPKEAYTNHVWVHTYYGIDEKKNEDIFKLMPKAKSVKQILDEMEKKSVVADKEIVEKNEKLGFGF